MSNNDDDDSDDSDDDDLLLVDHGLSKKRRNTHEEDAETQRRLKLNAFLTEALEDDAQLRSRQERLTQILADNTNTVEQAESALAEANAFQQQQQQQQQQQKTEEQDTETTGGFLKQEPYHSSLLSSSSSSSLLTSSSRLSMLLLLSGKQKDNESRRWSVQETAASDLLGTRRNVIQQIRTRPKLWTPNEVLQTLDRTKDHQRDMIRKYLQPQSNDLLIYILQKKTLNKKLVDFPQPLLDWLWRCSIDYESDYRDGAYATLKEYFMENHNHHHTNRKKNHGSETKPLLKTMMEQWTAWFEDNKHDDGDDDNDGVERIREESLRDVQYWLDLWNVLLEHDGNNSTPHGGNHLETDIVTDLIVVLSKMSLDEQFHGGRGYRPDCQVAGSWRKTVSIVLSRTHSGLPSDQWASWVSRTCNILLGIPIEAASENAEDADDKNNYLSRSLLVRNFSLGISTDFGLRLGMTTLAQILDVQDWDSELSKVQQEWLACLSKEKHTKDLVCLSCAMLIIDRKGDEIKVDGPRVLACVKSIHDCTLRSMQGAGETDIFQWVEFFDQQVLNLVKVMMRFSTQAHHRRAEVVLSSLRSYLKTCINEKNSARGMVQSSLDRYYKNETED